jgi:hypothetical protein
VGQTQQERGDRAQQHGGSDRLFGHEKYQWFGSVVTEAIGGCRYFVSF